MDGHDAVLGIDGCPGGWVGALVTGPAVTWYDGPLASLLQLPASAVAVDIPLGLPRGGTRRACDLLAAARLGAQRASVFPAPPRAVLAAGTHQEASALSRAAGSVGVSIQTWNIVPKIREADAARDPRLLEVHPELSFRLLAGGPLPSKRSAAGREARVTALRGWLPGLAVPSPRPGRAAVDDCLDALACAWTARRWLRGEAEVLGGGPDDVDRTGQVMRIVV